MKLDMDKDKEEETRKRMEKRAEGAPPTATTPAPQMGWNRQISDLQTMLANIESLFYVDITDGKTTRRVPLVEVLRKGIEEVKEEGPAVRDAAEELRREIKGLRSDVSAIKQEYRNLASTISAIKVPNALEPSAKLYQVASDLDKAQEGVAKETKALGDKMTEAEKLFDSKLPRLTEGARKYFFDRNYAPLVCGAIITLLLVGNIWWMIDNYDKDMEVKDNAAKVEQWAKSVQLDQNRGAFADWLIDEWAEENPNTWRAIDKKWREKNKGK